jgi:hypothetical protein
MPEEPDPLCDVVACHQPATGSYLQAADAGSVEFAVCRQHLTELRAGARPTVVAGRLEIAQLRDGK